MLPFIKSSSCLIQGVDIDDELTDWRILSYEPIVPPDLLRYEFSQTRATKETVTRGRHDAASIVRGLDQQDRLMVIVCPSALHDPQMLLEYCSRLMVLREKHKHDLFIVMRTSLEKIRQSSNGDDAHNSLKINQGLRTSRQLFLKLTEMGMPLASEMLDVVYPQYFGDLISVGAMGARNTESQLHRELASGLSFPVGFSDSADGCVDEVIDAVAMASQPRRFPSVATMGIVAIASTTGNEDCFVILQGGASSPNLTSLPIEEIEAKLKTAGMNHHLMIDCSSHQSSGSTRQNQINFAHRLTKQIADGVDAIMGVMIESNSFAGCQNVPPEILGDGNGLTSPGIGWDDGERMLEELAAAVKQRRNIRARSSPELYNIKLHA